MQKTARSKDSKGAGSPNPQPALLEELKDLGPGIVACISPPPPQLSLACVNSNSKREEFLIFLDLVLLCYALLLSHSFWALDGICFVAALIMVRLYVSCLISRAHRFISLFPFCLSTGLFPGSMMNQPCPIAKFLGPKFLSPESAANEPRDGTAAPLSSHC